MPKGITNEMERIKSIDMVRNRHMEAAVDGIDIVTGMDERT